MANKRILISYGCKTDLVCKACVQISNWGQIWMFILSSKKYMQEIVDQHV